MKVIVGKCLVLLVLLWSCNYIVSDNQKFIFLSSTIGPIDSGIVGALEDQFEKETGIRVRHVGAGTGAALKLATKGQIDPVMAHAKSLEEKFIADGFGTERIPLMYNDFVIVGPAEDPAAIKGGKSATEALKKIMSKGVKYENIQKQQSNCIVNDSCGTCCIWSGECFCRAQAEKYHPGDDYQYAGFWPAR